MDKFTRKYLLLAKTLAADNTACASRKLGGVLVTEDNIPITFGYNGSAKGLPHSDTDKWLDFVYDNLFSTEEKLLVGTKGGFIDRCEGKCPRRFLNIKSGKKLEYCNCSHLERNLIFHAAYSGHSTKNSHMFIFSPLPCHECAIACIQSGIKKIVCLKAEKDYSATSRKMLEWAHIEIEEINEKEINN